MNLNKLFSSISSRNCVLFAGSGLTCDSGGALWSDLVEYVVNEFNYSSPLTDNFDIIQDILQQNDPEKVYNTVKKRLSNAKISDDIIDLAKLPWYATFTTNYDLALENALITYQKLLLRIITTGYEFHLDGHLSELLCVKLMGSLDIAFNQPGSMILDKGDLAIAQEERGRIFNTLASHAANKSFLFYGYSFSDDIFFTILSMLSKKIGKPKNTFYAFFPEEPDSQMQYKLKQNNVEIIVDTPKNFVDTLTHGVSLRNPKNLTEKKIQIGDEIAIINTTEIGQFLSNYCPVFFDELEENIEPKAFFQGNTSSLKPFNEGWHYNRKEIDEITNNIISDSSRIISVVGYPGTGRTFSIIAAVNQLIHQNKTLAIRIPGYAINKIPDYIEIQIYLDEILTSAKKMGITPERLVFFSDSKLELSEILSFNKIASLCDFPLYLIFETEIPHEEQLKTYLKSDIKFINVTADLSLDERENIEEYLLNTTRIHMFPEVSSEEIKMILSQEKSFLPIIYRILDPAKRSINQIIEIEYSELTKLNPIYRDCISFCTLSSYFNLPMPISILKKGIETKNQKIFTYNEIFEFVEFSNKFIKEISDDNQDIYFSIHHKILADRISELNGIQNSDKYLTYLASSLDLHIKIDSDFFNKLFIENGSNLSVGSSKPYSKHGLIEAFEMIKNQQPARPVLHHLARLYEMNDIYDSKIMPLLNQALQEPSDRYLTSERKENVQTTKAKLMWKRDHETLKELSIDDPQVQEILILLEYAQSSRNPNPHAYDVHVRILREIWADKDTVEKLRIISNAIEILRKGLDLLTESPIDSDRLNQLLVECTREIDPIDAEWAAKELFDTHNDGVGYYTLARIEYYNKNLEKALEYLNIAITAEKCSLNAIALKIEILFESSQPDYKALFDLAEKIPDTVYKDNWKTAYFKGVIYFINGYEKTAKRYFIKSSALFRGRAYNLPRYIFWMENGHRKIFNGIISPKSSTKEGRIYSYNIPEWDEDIYFRPIDQKLMYKIKSSMRVEFELGFTPKGPIGFELRPFNRR